MPHDMSGLFVCKGYTHDEFSRVFSQSDVQGGITVKVGVLVATGQDWGTNTEMWRKEWNEREETEEKRNV